MGNFERFLLLAAYQKKNSMEYYQSVKQFGSTKIMPNFFCWVWSGTNS